MAAGTSPASTAVDGKQAKQAKAAAQGAKAKVDALLQRYQDANAEVDVAVSALTRAFGAGADAEVTDAEAATQARRARARQAAQVRAIYATGGPAGLTVSVLGATSPDEALWRASTADRVLVNLLADTRDQVAVRANLATLTRRRTLAADAATAAQASALQVLQGRADIAGKALAQAHLTLATLDDRAQLAQAALESAREIAAAQKAAAAARRVAMGPVTALGIPADYEHTYQDAAKTCPGLNWTLLAAVGQVESGHGRNNGPSSAGAIGPMQFRPATFALYAVDGDRDGVLDAWDQQDAIFTAANYLCRSGAEGGSVAGVHAALLAYNRAEWYVDLVLAVQQAIRAEQLSLRSP